MHASRPTRPATPSSTTAAANASAGLHAKHADARDAHANPRTRERPAAQDHEVSAPHEHAGATAANHVRGDAKPHADSRAQDVPSDFDRMLDSGEAATSSLAPGQPSTANTASTDTGNDDAKATADTTDAASLPGQLLALLAGVPLPGAAADTTTAVATPVTQAVTTGATAPVLQGLATATALPTLPGVPAAAPAAANQANLGIADSAAALAALLPAADSAGAATPAANTDTLSTFATLFAEKDRGDALAPGTPDTTPDARSALGALHATGALMPRTAVAPAAAVASLPVLDLDNGFDDAFGAHIGWMADQKLGEAELRVTPEHMGPIDVRLQLDGTRVTAQFQSAQPEVRHAIESSLTRLRDMLGQQGLQLANADVGHRQTRPGSGTAAGMATHGEAGTESDAPRPAQTLRRLRGLLDEYA